MSAITAQEVEHLAHLARLELTDAERIHYAEQLDVILDAVAAVSQAPTEGVPPTTHAVPVTNVVRDDANRPSLGAEAALSGAPAAEDGRFRVPRILGEE